MTSPSDGQLIKGGDKKVTISGSTDSLDEVTANGLKIIAANYTYDQLLEQIKVAPQEARHQLFMGLFLSNAGKRDEALKYLNDALALSPRKQTIYFEIAKIYLQQNKLSEALKVAAAALKLEPEYPEARKFYASLLIYAGDLKKADEVLVAGFDTVLVNDPIIINTYADARLFDRVLKIWQIRAAENPADFQNWVSLAAAYLNVGERTKSIETLQQAIKINSNFKSEGERYISEIRAGRNP